MSLSDKICRLDISRLKHEVVYTDEIKKAVKELKDDIKVKINKCHKKLESIDRRFDKRADNLIGVRRSKLKWTQFLGWMNDIESKINKIFGEKLI